MQEKALITVIGEDRVGIIAKVATLLAEANVNILDISQTITGGLFTMIMMVDITHCNLEFEALKKSLSDLGEQLNLKIEIQHENIFRAMHRI
ncbi:hypothetical protein ciss_09840 [Carboxydothermus islandicus]|uniref:UPF0237 protein ciss_09840 n=1 Tax=Carboxydothermus islandicus TaxID=661089 RepID=A0A1L8D1S8_9THEO|nr:ACT domain-containing protein [Carboxydothermus islandicus]GAV25051.1 hypothetical protein ciss_09840 [Carboxydothermus islandicus]